MTRRARITQSEVSRVIRAAVKSGERTVIEIEPSGVIRLIPNDTRQAPAKPVKEIEAL
jgi:hypothetical protein